MTIQETEFYKEAFKEVQEFFDNHTTLQEAWEKFDNAKWMLWVLGKIGIGYSDTKKIRLFACWCALETPLGDGRTMRELQTKEALASVEVSRRYAHGEATALELTAADAWASWASRDAFDLFDEFRYCDAWVNAWANSVAYTASDRSAWSCALANAVDAADDAVASAAQANQLRTMIQNPFLGNDLLHCDTKQQ